MNTNMGKPYHATLVSHTHWDRAWYVTFQEYGVRLVRLVDRLLALMPAQPDYKVYMLDGQTIILEDYLEIRPQRAPKIQALASDGRLQIGPWYVLADEFLVSPESLIRNLMLGHRMSEPYGGVVKVGYVPDGFGHIAQLPQILRGFDIDNAFFWRGMGPEGDRLGTEFEWIAPDGSHVTSIFMPFGYHNVSNLGYAIHWGDTSQMEFDWDLALAKIRKAVDDLKPLAHTDALLLMNGIDHAEPEPHIPEVVRRANERLNDVEVEHGTLLDHLARVRASEVTLPDFQGEFRWGRYAEILQGVYATRIHLKQDNHRVETLLERYMEPLNAFAWFSAADVPEGVEDLGWTAWRWLLKNHPHDDIYGCGVDQIHEEMTHRFSQAEQIGRVLVRDALRHIARQVDFEGQPGIPILIYNPLNWERQEVVTGDLDFVFDDPLADDFQIVDCHGRLVPHYVLKDEEIIFMEVLKGNRKRRVRVAFPADVPPCGYATCYIQPRTDSLPESGADWQVAERGAANSYISFTIEANGGLTVTDKVTGHTYANLGHFHDVEDAGDEYTYAPCPHSQTITTAGRQAEVTRVIEGPVLVTYRIEHILPVPVGLTDDRQRRSPETVDLPITSYVTLYRDQPGLFMEAEVDNRARDHKLSVVFPTDLRPAQVQVDESFMVIGRDTDLPPSEGWVEDPTPLMHQRAFTDLSDGQRGLAVLNRGLPAVEVTRTDGGTQIALVLLRSVGWLSRDDLSTRRGPAGPVLPTPGAQCLRRYRFEYAVLPHRGDWRQVYRLAYDYVAPLLVTRGDAHEGLNLHEMNITGDDPALVTPRPWPRGGPNPDRLSFVQIEPHTLVVSAVRRAANGSGLVVRFYNITPEPVLGTVTSWRPLEGAYRLNLNEERRQSLSLAGDRVVSVPVAPAQVVTLELIPRHQAG